jgi:hypothetical protein
MVVYPFHYHNTCLVNAPFIEEYPAADGLVSITGARDKGTSVQVQSKRELPFILFSW